MAISNSDEANNWFSSLVRGAFFFGIAGMILFPVRGEASPGVSKNLNDGYFLLHQVCGEEAQLPLLLIVKHNPPEMGVYVDQIAKTSRATLAVLDRFQKDDASIRFDRNPLPQAERDVRASIKADKQHQLLFGTSDFEFVRALLVAQIEAGTYALNLSKVLAEQETDANRAKALRHLSARWLGMRTEAFRLLRHY